jgi:hypothetical protein
MAKAATKTKTNPFKTKKTSASSKGLDTLQVPEKMKGLIDEFREAADQAKKYDGMKKALAAQIKPYAYEQAASRRMSGNNSNFNMTGNEKTCQFQVTEKVSAHSEESLAEFTEIYSEKATTAIFEENYSAVKLNGTYLREHWDTLIPKLTKALGDHFSELFSEVPFGLAEDGLNKAKEFANSPAELVELFEKMKVTSFIK